MSLMIPGQILQRVTITAAQNVVGTLLSSAYSTTFTAANMKKGNCIMVTNGNTAVANRLTLDGTTPSATVGLDLFLEKNIFVFGLPSVQVFSSDAGGVAAAEVYLCYSPAFSS